MNPEMTIAILTFIAFSIPIVGALWKIFAVRERLQTQIQTVNHRVDLIETHFESFLRASTLSTPLPTMA
jgi:hypothetical protein